jgi:hypothetical protein
MVELRQHGNAGLSAVEQLPTLRDRIQTIPVESAIPNRWEVGCKVVKFKDELPADAITLKRPRRSQELILTTAGTDGNLTLGVYEHDRSRGRRTRVATTEHRQRQHLRQTLYEAFTTTCRHAARIDGLPPSVAKIEVEDPAVVFDRNQVLAETDDGVVTKLLGKFKVY